MATSRHKSTRSKSAPKRRSWTDGEIREIKNFKPAKSGKSSKLNAAAQIAKKLKRTEGAVRQKALDLGISLASRAA